MKRTTHLARAATSQLELPLGRQETMHDLSYYIGLGKLFATYHKRWPTVESTREEFRAARVPDYDGQRIDRELRFPAPGLEADPAYAALRARCLADGMVEGVSLAAIDPRYRTVLNEDDIDDLFASIVLPHADDAGAGAVRYATGVPAHGPGELTLHVGDTLRAQALGLAGRDPGDPRVVAAGFSLRVQATAALKDFIDRAGVRGPAVYEHLADDYLLEAGDGGHLFLRFQLFSGRRYAGRFGVDRLARQLAAVYRADPTLAGLRAGTAAAPPSAPAIPAAPAPGSDEELHEQLAALEPEGRSLVLPIQALSRFADIRRALERAGAVYSAHAQRFDFEDGVEPAAVVERLLSGGVP